MRQLSSCLGFSSVFLQVRVDANSVLSSTMFNNIIMVKVFINNLTLCPFNQCVRFDFGSLLCFNLSNDLLYFFYVFIDGPC